MGCWKNQRRNQKINGDKLKWKHNDQKSTGCSRSSSKRKFIAIQVYLREQEKSHINNLTLHLKELGKEEKTKPEFSRRKEIIKIREEINKTET